MLTGISWLIVDVSLSLCGMWCVVTGIRDRLWGRIALGVFCLLALAAQFMALVFVAHRFFRSPAC